MRDDRSYQLDFLRYLCAGWSEEACETARPSWRQQSLATMLAQIVHDGRKAASVKQEASNVHGSASFMANVGSALLCRRWASFSS